MDPVYMNRLGAAFIEELTAIQKTAAAPIGLLSRAKSFLGGGFSQIGHALGPAEKGVTTMAQRFGAKKPMGMGEHIKSIYQKGAKGEGGMWGGIKGVAGSPYGQAAAAGGTLIGAGALGHAALSGNRQPQQPAYYQ